MSGLSLFITSSHAQGTSNHRGLQEYNNKQTRKSTSCSTTKVFLFLRYYVHLACMLLQPTQINIFKDSSFYYWWKLHTTFKQHFLLSKMFNRKVSPLCKAKVIPNQPIDRRTVCTRRLAFRFFIKKLITSQMIADVYFDGLDSLN